MFFINCLTSEAERRMRDNPWKSNIPYARFFFLYWPLIIYHIVYGLILKNYFITILTIIITILLLIIFVSLSYSLPSVPIIIFLFTWMLLICIVEIYPFLLINNLSLWISIGCLVYVFVFSLLITNKVNFGF